MLSAKPKTEMTLINLTLADEIMAARVGHTRTIECIAKHHSENSDVKRTLFENIANQSAAVAAEIAVARLLGFTTFDPSGTRFKNNADVGANVEVKWSRWFDTALHIQPTDRDTDVAVLVVGNSPNLNIIGWMPVINAKRPRYKHSKFRGWAVSQINLHPIESLLRSNYGNVRI